MPAITGASRKTPGIMLDDGGFVTNAMHPDYGGIANGSADDTDAVNNALAALLVPSGSRGGTCFLGDGKWMITAPLVPPGNSTYQDSSHIRLLLAPGARLYFADTTPGRALIDLRNATSQEGTVIVEGGILDGSLATATSDGINLHTQNIQILGTTVRRFKRNGIVFTWDLAAPPICAQLHRVRSMFNGVGLNVPVTAGGLSIVGGRYEANEYEGMILDGCAHVNLDGVTCETNGSTDRTKSNLRVKGTVMGKIAGCHFESWAYQDHSNVRFEAGASTVPQGLEFVSNQVTGYYCDASGTPLLNSIGVDIAPGSGLVDSIVEYANNIVGHTTGVRLGTNSRAHQAGPDYFSDSYATAPAWNSVTTYFVSSLVTQGGVTYVSKTTNTNQVPPNATHWAPITIKRYDRSSTQFGVVRDVNKHDHTIYDNLTHDGMSLRNITWLEILTAALGVKVTGGTTVAGSIVKHSAFGLLFQAVAGSGSDAGLVNPGAGLAVWDVPTGTIDMRFGGHVKLSTVGKGLFVKEGTNARMGKVTLVAGSATVATTAMIGAASRILLTSQLDGGTPGFLRVSTRVNGVSFTIQSSSATDTSEVAWLIVEPA